MSAGTVTVSAPVTFRTWSAPNFAQPQVAPGRRQDGLKIVEGVPVASLSPAVLDALAAAWLEDLYAKTGRACPFALTAETGGRNEGS